MQCGAGLRLSVNLYDGIGGESAHGVKFRRLIRTNGRLRFCATFTFTEAIGETHSRTTNGAFYFHSRDSYHNRMAW